VPPEKRLAENKAEQKGFTGRAFLVKLSRSKAWPGAGASRRSNAVTVDHLAPVLATMRLTGDWLTWRNSWKAARRPRGRSLQETVQVGWQAPGNRGSQKKLSALF